jgi:hypothetical protein
MGYLLGKKCPAPAIFEQFPTRIIWEKTSNIREGTGSIRDFFPFGERDCLPLCIRFWGLGGAGHGCSIKSP